MARPFSFLVLAVVAIVAQVVLTRLRIGWRIMAVGGSRRAAYNAGIPVRATVCLTYVVSGVLTSLAGTLYAARLSGAGPDTGLGLELSAMTAALLGGNSVGGGRGSVGKALMGAIIVSLLTNGLVRLGLESGASSMVVGLVLLLAIAIDVRWGKWRHKLRAKVYVSPAYLALPPAPRLDDVSSPYAMNDRLRDVEIIGLGEVDGPEDVILDEDDNLYCSVRQGEIVRFLAPDHVRREVYAHVGGRPLGMAFDREGGLVVCIAGMGLYRVDKQRNVHKMTAETNRSPFSIIDDSRMRLADDLDIAPDGKIYFSEATIRYGFEEWVVDALEGRGNGRIIRYDPAAGTTRTILRNLLFANGMCIAHDSKSVLFAETWGCRVSRYWLEGPKAGTTEVVVADLPGYPDNINRGSNGTYWVALAGTRTPSYDLAMTMPAFRRRMARRVAGDEWLFPNVNVGCVIHFDEEGRVLETLVGPGGRKPSGDHLDARTSRLSLSRRRHQQPHRSAQAPWRRSALDRAGLLLGRAPMKPRQARLWTGGSVAARPRSRRRRWTARSVPTICSTPPRRCSRRRRRMIWRSRGLGWSFPPDARCSASNTLGRRAGRFLRRRHQRARGIARRRRGGRPCRRPHRLRRRPLRQEDDCGQDGRQMHHRAGGRCGRRLACRQRLRDSRTGRLETRPHGERRLRLGVAAGTGERRVDANCRRIWPTRTVFSMMAIRSSFPKAGAAR